MSVTGKIRGLALCCVLVAGATGCAPLAPPPQQEDSGTPQTQDPEIVATSPGLSYAEKACASCHAVRDNQGRSPDPRAPSFEVIANTPGMTTMALNVWLHSPHKNMPLVAVDPDKIEDLSAYLYTLKEK